MLNNLSRFIFSLKSGNCYSSVNLRRLMCSKDALENQTKKLSKEPETTASISRQGYKPSNLERKVLVWIGRYKSVEEIPATVPVEVIETGRSKARIKIANYIMLATVIACFFVAMSGKKAAKRGESVQKMNLDWHREINEKK